MNRCIYRSNCDKHHLCFPCKKPMQNSKCSSCSKCNEVCLEFKEIKCEKLEKFPYVCNGCKEEYKCVLHKKFYIAEVAQKEYEKELSGARAGAAITEEERVELATTLAAGMQKGQSIHHIMASQPDLFNISERTIYTYVNTNILPGAGRSLLPVAPKLKPQRKKGIVHKVNKRCRENREFEDFKLLLEQRPSLSVVEMDTLLGVKGGNVLLTLNFNACGLMLAFIREANNSQSVIDIFNMLEECLGLETFKKLFPVILTDNGSEFSNPEKLEHSHITGEIRSLVFYCKPYSSWQKAHVENNHLNLRNIFPKGEPIPSVTQEKMAEAISHLNSMLREGYNDQPAITIFEKLYGKGILEKIGVSLVPAKEIILTPKVLKE